MEDDLPSTQRASQDLRQSRKKGQQGDGSPSVSQDVGQIDRGSKVASRAEEGDRQVTRPTFSDFCINTVKGFNSVAHPSLRYGQWFFQELHNVHQGLAEHIRGTKFDPFYKDHVGDDTLHYLMLMWENVDDFAQVV
jgi:hypothetical protein